MKLKLMFILIMLIGCKGEVPVEEEQPTQIIVSEEVEEEPSEVVVEEAIVEVILTSDTQMNPDELTISVGTTVRWINEGKWARNLMIYDASIEDLKEEDVVRSQNILTDESFEYTFEKPGEYIIKDIYKYSVRGQITAEVVNSVGDEMGIVYVE